MHTMPAALHFCRTAFLLPGFPCISACFTGICREIPYTVCVTMGQPSGNVWGVYLMRNIFARVKAHITARQAAEAYGLRVGRNGMALCPFHDDHTPSMKIDDRYYCFGCGETGDVIDLTARLFRISPFEAARKLAADFGIDPDTPGAPAQPVPCRDMQVHRDVLRCTGVLIDYETLLKRQKKQYAPQDARQPVDERFVHALHSLPEIGGLIDQLYDADVRVRKETARWLLESGRLDEIRQALREEETHEQHATERAA